MEVFDIAATTDDDDEERWAFELCRQLYVESTSHDEQVTFFEALAWAAEHRQREELPPHP